MKRGREKILNTLDQLGGECGGDHEAGPLFKMASSFFATIFTVFNNSLFFELFADLYTAIAQNVKPTPLPMRYFRQ